MGFWHISYMEHHEDLFFEVLEEEPVPTVYACPQCAETFDTHELLRDHQFEGHPVRMPALLFRGMPVGRLGITVVRPTEIDDWQVVDASTASVDGRIVDVGDVGPLLSQARDGIYEVELADGPARCIATVDVAVPSLEELGACDEAFGSMMASHELSLQAVQRFVDDTRGLSTASGYRDGIATYLQGVILREGLEGSWVERSEYRNLYERAHALLAPYDRPLATSICSLVSFHFNDFAAARRSSASLRVSWAAERFERLLQSDRTHPSWGEGGQSSFDVAITDDDLEAILAWTCSAGSDTSPHLLARMEGAHGRIEKLDRTKEGILIAEACLKLDDPARGVPFARELVHDHLAGRWASDYLDLVGAA